MPTKPLQFAAFLIAACALSTGVRAQNVYRCGDSYSQTPCPGAKLIEPQDSRQPAQKKQTDTATHSNASLAQELQKERLAQEKLAKSGPPPIVATAVAKAPQSSASATVLTPKRIRPQLKKPEQFVAEVPGTEKKVSSKPASKKTSAP
jgi:hypothetical protein